MLVEKLLRMASDNLPASESWLARFCSIMSDVERSKLTIDEFGGLFLQAIVKADRLEELRVFNVPTPPRPVHPATFRESNNHHSICPEQILQGLSNNPLAWHNSFQRRNVYQRNQQLSQQSV